MGRATRRRILLWAERGVRVFRVDNPHTKPLAFWEWLIRDTQNVYPDTIFLAEAFTRPKMMKELAKLGFSQSYTYFTWRNTKAELQEYLTELTQTPMREYFRGNFFANTPDILPPMLQLGGRPAFRMRLVLAATLSSVYGIYNGFELIENRPRGDVGATEYYLDSEMYQHKVWDWDRPGNIVDRRDAHQSGAPRESALQLYDNLRFYPVRQRPVARVRQGHARPHQYRRCASSTSIRSGRRRAGSTCRCRTGVSAPISHTSCMTC